MKDKPFINPSGPTQPSTELHPEVIELLEELLMIGILGLALHPSGPALIHGLSRKAQEILGRYDSGNLTFRSSIAGEGQTKEN
jgi:hypothetical protein